MIQSIVVGTDGSATATEAVRRAGGLARTTGARVHLVSAYKPLAGARVSGSSGPAPEEAEWAVGPDVQVESVLTEAAGALSAMGVGVESYARRGDPAEILLTVAEEQDADLIVVGNKGMRGTKRFLLGSIPDKISHHAPCSVMIVRTT